MISWPWSTFLHNILNMEQRKFLHFAILICLSLFVTELSSQVNVLTEDFEGATLNVTSSSASGNNNNAWSINTNLQSNGSKSDTAKVALGDTLYLETNAFNTNTFSNVSLSFDQICKIDFFDRAFLEYSTNNGSTWTRLTNTEYNGSGFFSTSYFSSVSYTIWNPGSANATPTNTWWRSESFDLSATAGNSQVKVRWMLVDADNNGALNNYGWLIDNIVITAAPCELIPPTIVLAGTTYQGQVYSQGPYPVNATITDASGVASATLSYTVNSGAVVNLTMSNNTSTNWIASIPAATVGDTICYSITALDNTTCSNSTTFPSASSCTQFIVANNPPPSCQGSPVFSFNYLESFASFTPGNGTSTVGFLQNNWVNDNNDTHDWWVYDQATGSGGTGPSADHSLGDANYLYIEASGTFSNKQAIINTPCYDFTNLSSPKFDFYYHMRGANMGELHLDIFFGGQWLLDVMPVIRGDQGPNWNYRRVDLSQYAGSIVKLRFRGITGINFQSDIAIDDIEIIEPLSDDIGLTNIFSPRPIGCTGSANEFITFEIANFGSSPQDTIPMAYRLNGGSIVRDTSFNTLLEGDTVNFTFQQTANMSIVGSYAFEFWIELNGDQKTTNDSLLTYTINTSNVIAVFPDTNDFDNYIVGNPGSLMDGWSNDPSADNHDWYVRTGGTPSAQTGPTGDHTSGSGNYMYVEASTFNNRQANLNSKCLDLNNLNQPELNFFFHMDGIEMGELHLDININGVFIQDIITPIIGNQGSLWRSQVVNLTPYKGNVRLTFRAIVGNGYRSDIAIDDVTLRDANPVGLNETNAIEDGIEVYPNPVSSQLNIRMSGSKTAGQLQIFNSIGKVVWESNSLNANWTQIDVSQWSKGMYQIIFNDGKESIQQKLIVQ